MAVTLETLRADLEAADHAHNSHDIFFVLDDDDWAEEEDRLMDAWLLAFDILEIAERHGLKAAMLYKLSDGNIDPRKKDGDA